MDVAIVIPNYNGKHLLIENIPSVISSCRGAEIIVIDDGSTDGSAEYIEKEFPDIKIIKKATNTGFASSVNLGVRAAQGEVVVLLNTDVIPHKDFLKPLIAHFIKDQQVFAVGCLDESLESGQIIKRGRGLGQFVRGFLQHGRGEINGISTLWASGGSSAFRKSLWFKLGGMDELYSPFYYEDIDISYRALKSGYKVLFEDKSIVEHHHEKGSIQSEYKPEYIKSTAYRNQFIFVWKNVTDTKLIISHILWLPYHIMKSLTTGDNAFVLGFIKALAMSSQIIANKRWQKKMYMQSDQAVLNNYSI